MRNHSALLRFIAERAEMPFVWGRRANDCVSFAFGAVEALTGKDYLDGLDWNDEDEAYRVIEEVGGLETALSASLTKIAPAHAHRGDVAGLMTGNHLYLMIVEGPTLVGPGPLRRVRHRVALFDLLDADRCT